MDASNPTVLARKLAERQVSASQALDELRAALAPGTLADRVKQAAATEAKAATFDPQGKLKTWVYVAAAVTVGLAITGLIVRLSRRSK